MKKNELNSQITKILRNKTVLVTGGAGSVGSYLTKKLLEYPIKSVRVLDINEHSLFCLKREVNDSRVRFLLGSVLDKDRIDMATDNVDIIIHTAAIKNIEISEFNPLETIATNVDGTINLIKTALKNKTSICLNVSTDKAAEPSTLYGTTKLLSEKLITWAGLHSEHIKFGNVRFGNIFETKGNVFELWDKQAKMNSPITITNMSMSRYFFHIEDAVNFILKCLTISNNGEIFVPKMKLYKMKDLAEKYSKKQKIIGLRSGEKLEEVLITVKELEIAENKSDMWIISNKL